MKTVIDRAGRVVIPIEIRRRAHLQPGNELEIRVDDDASVRLSRSLPGPKLVRAGRRTVARPQVPASDLPKLDLAALIAEERNRWPW